MATSKQTRRCARCGHPKNKHTTNSAAGCTVRVWQPKLRALAYCTCRYYVERVS